VAMILHAFVHFKDQVLAGQELTTTKSLTTRLVCLLALEGRSFQDSTNPLSRYLHVEEEVVALEEDMMVEERHL